MRGYIFKFWEEIFKIDHQIRYKCLYFEQEEKKERKKKSQSPEGKAISILTDEICQKAIDFK